MRDTDGRAGTPSILGAVVKTTLAVGFLALCGANWMVSGFDPRDAARAVSVARRDVVDPVSTGSLSHSAATTNLDPCALPRTR